MLNKTTGELVEGTIPAYGNCKFCGQAHMLETVKEETQEQLDIWATEKCSCDKAKEERKRITAEKNAAANIEKLFGEYDAGMILKAAVHSVAIEAIDAVVINIGNGVKATMKMNNNGKIKVIKTTTNTQELESR